MAKNKSNYKNKNENADETVRTLDKKVMNKLIKGAESNGITKTVDNYCETLKFYTEFDASMDYLTELGSKKLPKDKINAELQSYGIPSQFHEAVAKRADKLNTDLFKFQSRICSHIRTNMRAVISKKSKKLKAKGRESTIVSRMAIMAEEYEKLTGKEFNLKEAQKLLAAKEATKE